MGSSISFCSGDDTASSHEERIEMLTLQKPSLQLPSPSQLYSDRSSSSGIHLRHHADICLNGVDYDMNDLTTPPNSSEDDMMDPMMSVNGDPSVNDNSTSVISEEDDLLDHIFRYSDSVFDDGMIEMEDESAADYKSTDRVGYQQAIAVEEDNEQQKLGTMDDDDDLIFTDIEDQMITSDDGTEDQVIAAVEEKEDKMITADDGIENQMITAVEDDYLIFTDIEDHIIKADDGIEDQVIAADDGMEDNRIAADDGIENQMITAVEDDDLIFTDIEDQIIKADDGIEDQVIAADDGMEDNRIAADDGIEDQMITAVEDDDLIFTDMEDQVITADDGIGDQMIAAVESIEDQVIAADDGIEDEMIPAVEKKVDKMITGIEDQMITADEDDDLILTDMENQMTTAVEGMVDQVIVALDWAGSQHTKQDSLEGSCLFSNEVDSIVETAASSAPSSPRQRMMISSSSSSNQAVQGSPLSPLTMAPMTPLSVVGPPLLFERTSPLAALTVDDVSCLLDSLNLTNYTESVRSNLIDGESLMECTSEDDVKELGVSLTVKARLLLNKIQGYKTNGVPRELLQSSTQKSSATAALGDSEIPSSGEHELRRSRRDGPVSSAEEEEGGRVAMSSGEGGRGREAPHSEILIRQTGEQQQQPGRQQAPTAYYSDRLQRRQSIAVSEYERNNAKLEYIRKKLNF